MANFEYATFGYGWNQYAGAQGQFQMTVAFADGSTKVFTPPVGSGLDPLIIGLNALGQDGWEYSGEYHAFDGSGLYVVDLLP